MPYWTATLVTGEGAGTAEPTDFSFASDGTIVHTTHGSNTENIPVYVKRKESASPRSFRVKVEGVGLDGQTRSILLTVSQSGYDLRATTGLSSLGNISQTGGTLYGEYPAYSDGYLHTCRKTVFAGYLWRRPKVSQY